MTKPLSEMLEEIEPKACFGDSFGHNMVDRESYDRMKRVAIALAKALEYYSARLHLGKVNYSCVDREVFLGGGTELEFTIKLPFEDGKKAREALSRVKDIIGEGK